LLQNRSIDDNLALGMYVRLLRWVLGFKKVSFYKNKLIMLYS